MVVRQLERLADFTTGSSLVAWPRPWARAVGVWAVPSAGTNRKPWGRGWWIGSGDDALNSRPMTRVLPSKCDGRDTPQQQLASRHHGRLNCLLLAYRVRQNHGKAPANGVGRKHFRKRKAIFVAEGNYVRLVPGDDALHVGWYLCCDEPFPDKRSIYAQSTFSKKRARTCDPPADRLRSREALHWGLTMAGPGAP